MKYSELEGAFSKLSDLHDIDASIATLAAQDDSLVVQVVQSMANNTIVQSFGSVTIGDLRTALIVRRTAIAGALDQLGVDPDPIVNSGTNSVSVLATTLATTKSS
jgi:hypothetical protein